MSTPRTVSGGDTFENDQFGKTYGYIDAEHAR